VTQPLKGPLKRKVTVTDINKHMYRSLYRW